MSVLKQPISITAFSSISALGSEPRVVLDAYAKTDHYLSKMAIGTDNVWVGSLPKLLQNEIEEIGLQDSNYKNLDPTVLYSMYVARKTVAQANWSAKDIFGVNIGSSRGATQLFEKYHQRFTEKGSSDTLTSPTTTLGNISSWVAHDLKSKGPDISHSITCSTALHSLLNAIAWLQSGMSTKFLVGGSEAALTPFTIAQMQALKIYSKSAEAYPCRALDLSKKRNSMVLGDGAATAALELGEKTNALARIVGIGYATEPLEHSVSLSSDAQCFQDSMKMALGTLTPEKIDAVVMHAPGTVKGDASEYKAIKKTFGNDLPFLTTNKWKVGHTFGASGMLSLEMALLMLQENKVFSVPYIENTTPNKEIKNVLVNAVGFGGNAVSIVVSKS